MSLKKVKMFSVIFAFALSFLWHFIYDLIPCGFTALFFPVNESIWEHMKIIFYVLLVSSLVQWLVFKKFKIEVNNKYIEMMSKSIVGVIFYLAVFIPIYLLIGENLFVSIGLMLITYALMEWLGYKILESSELNIKIMPLIIIFLGMVLFGILTFYPQHNFLFFDEKDFGYGIIKK